jgi:mRNA-degrading endonuclease YafQ of YafQ-DinJ toxin-antitoxin module
MYEVHITGRFKKDLKTLKKRSPHDFEILRNFIHTLSESGFAGIDKKHKPHKLKGKFARHSEPRIAGFASNLVGRHPGHENYFGAHRNPLRFVLIDPKLFSHRIILPATC